jgi:hypothetical protein
MRHGRLAAALAVTSFAGLAAAQAPPRLSPFTPDLTPSVTSGTVKTPTIEVSTPAPAEARPAPAATSTPAVTAIPFATPAGPVTTLPPTSVSCTPAPTVVAYDNAGGEFWASIEYLAWRIKDDQAPALVTTGPAVFPVGFLGNPDTVILFGGDLDQGTFDGMRLRGGYWLNACRTYGIEAGFFCLEERNERTTFGSPVLARPFTDVNTGNPNSEFLAFTGIATGGITIDQDTKLCGLDLALRCNVCADCDKRLDILAGVQYLDLRESLKITETPRFAPTAPFPGLAGVQFVAGDQFKTRNRFYGPKIGFDATVYDGPFFAELIGSVAIGVTRQTIEISGYQRALFPDGTTAAFNGGLLALPGANIGRHTQTEVSSVSELGFNLGYRIATNVTVFGGYSILYWTNVVRPGRQIDPVLDVNRIPNFGTAPAATQVRPTVPFNQTDFWAQGVNLGIRLSW